MKSLLFLLTFSLCFASYAFDVLELFQYPDDTYVYSSEDRGLRRWRALSLYKTGVFTLTFDDGPHPTRTAVVLDVLKKHNTRGAFFVVTSQINNSNAHLIKRILDEGHILASHGFTHDRSSELAENVWKERVKRSFTDLARWHKVFGHEMTKFYYRFPYGNYGTRSDYHHINALRDLSRELMGENCIHMAFWDVDTADWVPEMTAQEIAGNIIAHNQGGTYVGFKLQGSTYVKVPVQLKDPPAGGVVLQHDVHGPTAEATDLFLTYAKENNLRIVPLDEVEEFKITKNCKL
jgi:peptidoglycan-N-acetylglucosamine deacetylase